MSASVLATPRPPLPTSLLEMLVALMAKRDAGAAVSRGAADGTGTACAAFEDKDCCLVAVAAANQIALYTPLPLEAN